jgi:hypothetical protein
MDRRALGAVASARRFAALAALVAAGLTRRAARPRAGPAGPAWHAAEGMVIRAAGGTVTETITSAYRTGR